MEKSTYIALAIFTLVIITGLIWFNSDDESKISERIIQVGAKWFEFNPNEIKVKQGEQVTLVINNMDVDHGINIPELGISGNDVVKFTPDKKGELTFYCNNFCGVNHEEMIGKIIVE